MSSIALIGPDGAGKTTVTRMLEQSGLLPFKYLYMGINISASNFALPTSRFAEYLRPRVAGIQRSFDEPASIVHLGTRGRKKYARRAWAAARLANRVADEWFRQLGAWYYGFRGYIILYDRHFVFDFAPEIVADKRVSFDERIHQWCLAHFFPRPDLVIFLDAPGEVLFARKGESSVAELERRRRAFLQQGATLSNFIRVDATRPLEDVYADVARHVVRFFCDSHVGSR